MSDEKVGAPFEVYIGSLEAGQEGIKVTAQFVPKELQVDKSVSWQKQQKSFADQPNLEFTSADGRTMSLGLLFDGYETGKSVQENVDTLLKLASIQKPDSKKADEKRPHKVTVAWGQNKLPPFMGVIESVSTKYTMFSSDGTPLRATCTVKLKEADKVSFKPNKGRG